MTLDELEALLAKATKGPWRVHRVDYDDDGKRFAVEADDTASEASVIADDCEILFDPDGAAHDASLAAALRNEAPALIARMRKLEAVAEAVDALMGADPIAYVDEYFQKKHGIDVAANRLRVALFALKAQP